MPDRFNVELEADVPLPRVDSASACGDAAGWYYDDALAPTHVVLCPASCDAAHAGGGSPQSLRVLFGCSTLTR